MYVADVTDIKELRELQAEVEDRLLDDPNNEQALWDQEDITERIEELNAERMTKWIEEGI